MLDRRQFFSYIPAAMAFVTTAGLTNTAKADVGYQNVGAIETIMRGHGLLSRAIIICDTIRERLAKGKQTDPSLILKTTAVIHNYLQDFHETMEEQYIFKPMEKTHNNFSSIQELKIQHGAARELMHRITNLAKAGKVDSELSNYLGAFGRMYKYHAAWEDTVIFPAFDAMENKTELSELAATFVIEEQKILGSTGFDSLQNDIAHVEKQLRIYDPSNWTAKL
jgi:hemerythrin-like domain-containing protein